MRGLPWEPIPGRKGIEAKSKVEVHTEKDPRAKSRKENEDHKGGRKKDGHDPGMQGLYSGQQGRSTSEPFRGMKGEDGNRSIGV